MTVRVLAFHAPYRCEHRGVCCTAGWPIPVEPDRRAALEPVVLAAMGPRLAAASATDDAGRTLIPAVHGACVLYDRDGRRCRAHAALGHDALPLACRQFPRVTVSDPRGTSVTLSHVCPTARRLLARGPIAIVSNTAGFPVDGEYVGLDAREALPPLLRRDMLMDWESWSQWEARAIEVIATHDGDPTTALAVLAGATKRIVDWSPARGRLDAAIDAAFDAASAQPGHWEPDEATRVSWIAAAWNRIPLELRRLAPAMPMAAAMRANHRRCCRATSPRTRLRTGRFTSAATGWRTGLTRWKSRTCWRPQSASATPISSCDTCPTNKKSRFTVQRSTFGAPERGTLNSEPALENVEL